MRGTVKKVFRKLNTRSVNSWFDRLTFLNILLVWTLVIISFGLLYHFFSNGHSYLYSTLYRQPITDIIESVYFSFITATTTGFGDIVPFGAFKLVAIAEVVFGLMLLAFVTSKLVSIKQDVILTEVYDLSFNEKVTRLRSSLLVFRQSLSRLFTKIEGETIKKRELQDLHIQITHLADTLNEIQPLLEKPVQSRYTKMLDPINAELIFTSILISFEKLAELTDVLNKHRLSWKREATVHVIHQCIQLLHDMVDKMKVARILPEKSTLDIETRKNTVVEHIQKSVGAPPAREKILPMFYEV